MEQAQINTPLNHHQLEILKLFTRDLDEQDLIEIKRLIVSYLGNKVSDMADKVWEDRKWTNTDMKNILKNHKRTPYNPKN